MDSSILQSTKKILGLDASYNAFDLDILTHINTAFSILFQMGIGPEDGYFIEDETATWEEFIGAGDPPISDARFNMVRSYVFLKVGVLFDPPQMGYLIDLKNNQIKELEWRLNVMREEVTPNHDELYPEEEEIEA